MKLIGLCGKMGSGKDTIADIMLNENLVQHRMSFATGVKEVAKELFDIDPKKRTPKSRRIWQTIGHSMRQLDDVVWIVSLMKRLAWIYDAEDDNVSVIITDVRYLNEARWILSNHGTVIIINADPYQRKQRIERRDNITIDSTEWVGITEHPSELEADLIYSKLIDQPNVYYYFNREAEPEYIKKYFLTWWDQNIKT